jgi:hypothetical protein
MIQPDRPATGMRSLIALSARLVAALVGVIVGAGIGFGIGANYGGNYATDFEFAGVRGYEATGLLGALIGATTMGVAGFALVARLTSRWSGPA